MWNKFGKQNEICLEYCQALEDLSAGVGEAEAAAELSGSLAAEVLMHAEGCERCKETKEVFWESRNLLAGPNASVVAARDTATTRTWFGTRVMAKIAEREKDVRAASAEWSGAVTRLASRLAWVSALALLVAGTLVYAPQPRREPGTIVSQTPAEVPQYLFDSASGTSNVDDALASPVER